jgi:hypothetical protein
MILNIRTPFAIDYEKVIVILKSRGPVTADVEEKVRRYILTASEFNTALSHFGETLIPLLPPNHSCDLSALLSRVIQSSICFHALQCELGITEDVELRSLCTSA